MNAEKHAALQKIVDSSDRIVFFGGAGVSTESGIPDFRSTDGLYAVSPTTRPEEILSHSYFMEHPDRFYDFYRANMTYLDAKPNAAHHALARLEQAGRLQAVITQNIDGLHQAAGSREVVELHGTIYANHCMRCGRAYTLEETLAMPGVPTCSCGGIIKPDVTLYGEMLPDGAIERAVAHVRAADVLIVGGTSLAVYPAAGLLTEFSGRELVVINRDPTMADQEATLLIDEPIGEVLGSLAIHPVSPAEVGSC